MPAIVVARATHPSRAGPVWALDAQLNASPTDRREMRAVRSRLIRSSDRLHARASRTDGIVCFNGRAAPELECHVSQATASARRTAVANGQRLAVATASTRCELAVVLPLVL